MSFTVKQASSGNWIVYLKGHGQFGESYATHDEAMQACIHYNQNVVIG